MPFCSGCGEIIRAGAACPRCGGSAAESLVSGFSSSTTSTATGTLHPVTVPNLLSSPPSTPPTVRKVGATTYTSATSGSGSVFDKKPPKPAALTAAAATSSSTSTTGSAAPAAPPMPPTHRPGSGPAKPVIAPSILTAPLSSSSATIGSSPPSTKRPVMPATKPLYLGGSISSTGSSSVRATPATPPHPAPVSAAVASPAKTHPTVGAATTVPVPVNARQTKDDDDIRCVLCYDTIPAGRERRTRENPADAYCLSCWAVRPAPEMMASLSISGSGGPSGAAAAAARAELAYQTSAPAAAAPSSTGRGTPSAGGSTPAVLERCAECHQVLGAGTHTLALNRSFHAGCFRCAECRNPVAGTQQFVERNGKPVCMDCHRADLTAMAAALVSGASRSTVTVPGVSASAFVEGRAVCAKCRTPIFTAVVALARGETRCTDCFVCDKCNLPIDSSYATEGSKILHPDCVTRESCVKCTFPIHGAYVPTKAGPCHSGCFRCASCSIELAGKPFAVVDGKETCAECIADTK
ncbi:hypothetical protein BC828DRAFT_408005 [Blastocladiella britannica]|nr:hypothetical protein BC828DRAFT_408005 [Blastocladiella britannica]